MSKKENVLRSDFYERLMKRNKMNLVETKTYGSTRNFLFFSPMSEDDKVYLGDLGEIQIVLYFEPRKMIPVALTPVLVDKERGFEFIGSPLYDGVNISVSDKLTREEIEGHISSRIVNLKEMMENFRDSLEYMKSIKMSRSDFAPCFEEFLQKKYNLNRGSVEGDGDIDFEKTNVEQYFVFDVELKNYLGERVPKNLFHFFILFHYYLGEIKSYPITIFEKEGSIRTMSGQSKGARVLTTKVTLPTFFMKTYEEILLKRREFKPEAFLNMLA